MDLRRRPALSVTLTRLICQPYASADEFAAINGWSKEKVRKDFRALRQAGYVDRASHTCIALPGPRPRHWVTNEGEAALRAQHIPERYLRRVASYRHVARRLRPRLDTVAIAMNLAAGFSALTGTLPCIRIALRRHPLDAIINVDMDRYIGIIHQGTLLPRPSLQDRMRRHVNSSNRAIPVLIIVPTLLDRDAAEWFFIPDGLGFVAVEDVALLHSENVWSPAYEGELCSLEEVLRQIPRPDEARQGSFDVPPLPAPKKMSLEGTDQHPMFALRLRSKQLMQLLPDHPFVSRDALRSGMLTTGTPLSERDVSHVVGPLLKRGLIVSERIRGVLRYSLSNSGIDLMARAHRASGPDMIGRLSPEEVPILNRRGEWHPGRWGSVIRRWERHATHEEMVTEVISLATAEIADSRWTLDEVDVAPRTRLSFVVPVKRIMAVSSARRRWTDLAGGERASSLQDYTPLRFVPDASMLMEDYATVGTIHEGLRLYLEIERRARTRMALVSRLLTYLTWSLVRDVPDRTHGLGILFVFQAVSQEAVTLHLMSRWLARYQGRPPFLATTTFEGLQKDGFLGPAWSVGPGETGLDLEAALLRLCPHEIPQ